MLLTDKASCRSYYYDYSAYPKNKWCLTSSGGGYLIVSPIGSEFSLEFVSTELWSEIPSDQEQSNMLWLYSLGYVVPLLESHKEVDLSKKILLSFGKFVKSSSGKEKIKRMTSWDHCLAELLRTLVAIYSINKALDFNDQELESIVEELIEFSVIESRKPDMVKMNNHGMMLVFSLMHVRLLPKYSGVDLEPVVLKLKEVLDIAFDPQGLCVENSPAYHEFYINFIGQMVRFLENTGGHKVLGYLNDLKSRSEKSLAKVILPDGSLPPLGDGNAKVTKLESISGSFFSPETGFYVKKSEKAYFSLKCGNSSFTHKHMDDTSIYLWYKGQELIVDGGIFNYDWKNQYSVAVKSQRGHSGAFFKELDCFYPASVFRGLNPRVKSSLAVTEDIPGKFFLQAVSHVDVSNTITREVLCKEGSIKIVDSFFSDSGFTPVSRFLFPRSCEISFSDGILLVRNGEAALKMAYDHKMTARIFKGESSGMLKGWRAVRLNVVEDCFCIEFEPPSGTSVNSFEISVEGSESDQFWGL